MTNNNFYKYAFIDVDGVVCDMHKVWLDLYNADYNDRLTPDDITGWGIHKFVKPECGERIYTYLEHPELYERAEPVPGALKAVESLRDRLLVRFITSCVPGAYDQKIAWLLQHGFAYDRSEVVAADDKHILSTCGILVDDQLHNLLGYGGIKMLFVQPWSEGVQNALPYVAHNWRDVVRIVQEVLSVQSAVV